MLPLEVVPFVACPSSNTGHFMHPLTEYIHKCISEHASDDLPLPVLLQHVAAGMRTQPAPTGACRRMPSCFQ